MKILLKSAIKMSGGFGEKWKELPQNYKKAKSIVN
jgi:hypothetical protein